MNDHSVFNASGIEVEQATTMPHSIEAEQQLLGAILTNNDVYDRVAAILGPQHFYDPVHRRIFEIAAARIAKNNLASPVTLKAFMEDDEGLKELGGPAYLARLAGAAVSTAAPTPGGIGATEAALVAGYTAVGVDASTAFAAVLLFRLVTFWLPILPGWLALVHLQRTNQV